MQVMVFWGDLKFERREKWAEVSNRKVPRWEGEAPAEPLG